VRGDAGARDWSLLERGDAKRREKKKEFKGREKQFREGGTGERLRVGGGENEGRETKQEKREIRGRINPLKKDT